MSEMAFNIGSSFKMDTNECSGNISSKLYYKRDASTWICILYLCVHHQKICSNANLLLFSTGFYFLPPFFYLV